jgi:hypothetical protein
MMLDTKQIPFVEGTNPLWDFAGIDGLQIARHLFGPQVSQLSPFQSLTTTFEDQPCAVLRLCEGNFRVVLTHDLALDEIVTPLQQRVWMARSPYLSTLTLPVKPGLEWLSQAATTKPVFTLSPFPCDRAVPARLDGIAILIWHYQWLGQPRLDLQMAATEFPKVQALIERSQTSLTKNAARARFEHHFGTLALDSATDLDNESIDADLAREYASTHEGE